MSDSSVCVLSSLGSRMNKEKARERRLRWYHKNKDKINEDRRAGKFSDGGPIESLDRSMAQQDRDRFFGKEEVNYEPREIPGYVYPDWD